MFEEKARMIESERLRPCPGCGQPISTLRVTCPMCGDRIYKSLVERERANYQNTSEGKESWRQQSKARPKNRREPKRRQHPEGA
jgi:uncharacterized Zn finger protein (UPF0148 family)